MATEATSYPYHPAACIFPMLDDDALGALANDIRDNGLQTPIEIFDDQIVDGRNRSTACLLAGVKPKYVKVAPDNVIAYVLSKNLHRRHLCESQRAMVAAKLATLKLGDNQHIKQGTQICVPSVSQLNAAGMLNVSVRSVTDAVKVIAEAEPEVIKQVEEGTLKVSKAAKQLTQQEETTEHADKPKPPSHAEVYAKIGNEINSFLDRLFGKWPDNHKHVLHLWKQAWEEHK